MNWVKLEPDHQPDGAGQEGWQWVGATGEAGGFLNDPSKLPVLEA